MSGAEIGLLSVLAVLVLVYAGVHVGVALGAASFFSIWLVRGDAVTSGKMLGPGPASDEIRLPAATGNS